MKKNVIYFNFKTSNLLVISGTRQIKIFRDTSKFLYYHVGLFRKNYLENANSKNLENFLNLFHSHL